MKRRDGTHDARDEQPVMGYLYFENGLRCSACQSEVPDDSLACPFCLQKDAKSNPAPPRSRRRKVDRASQERFSLNGHTPLD